MGNAYNWDVKTQYSPDAVYSAVAKITATLKGCVLDLAAGTGTFSRILQKQNFSEVFACDAYSDNFSVCGINCVAADLNKGIPYDNDSFDVVVGCEIIEHIENPRYLLREIKRILVKGGVGVITTTNNESLRAKINYCLRDCFPLFNEQMHPMHITPIICKEFKFMCLDSDLVLKETIFSDSGKYQN